MKANIHLFENLQNISVFNAVIPELYESEKQDIVTSKRKNMTKMGLLEDRVMSLKEQIQKSTDDETIKRLQDELDTYKQLLNDLFQPWTRMGELHRKTYINNLKFIE
jgi:predicted  nucleic acid-binding Zn-ribbon protein